VVFTKKKSTDSEEGVNPERKKKKTSVILEIKKGAKKENPSNMGKGRKFLKRGWQR